MTEKGLVAKAIISDRPISGRARILPPISDSYKPYPMPMPTRVFPLPTRFVSPAETTGTVTLNAQTSACGQLYPYSGSFTVCRGKIELLPGTQELRNSGSSGNLKLLIADPFSWQIEPADFFLSGGEEVKVSATGYNHLLMCPIQVSE